MGDGETEQEAAENAAVVQKANPFPRLRELLQQWRDARPEVSRSESVSDYLKYDDAAHAVAQALADMLGEAR
ncbi:hypothetical protein AB0D67_37650 [Streptosporangium sp. NPDC048047]|uniref:hypothetical protein n=1 Tax=Streptosporangium sp. NPDC048047 TaxID=3155748 RepID=UPI00343CAF76